MSFQAGCAGAIVVGAAAGATKVDAEIKGSQPTIQPNEPNVEYKEPIKPLKVSSQNILVSKIKPDLPVPAPKLKEKKTIHRKLSSLNGKTASFLKRLIGMPHFKRKDSHAEIWLYSVLECKLHFFLYPESSDNTLSVRYMETRPSQKYKISDDECLFKVTEKFQLKKPLQPVS